MGRQSRTAVGHRRDAGRRQAMKKKIIEANGVKYLVTEKEGRTKSGRKIRSCKWETYQETPKLF